ncbi:MAG: CoB--CoM heterodisulfide reductase iron-sulfur subunit B family protein [Deltaproteobacteria bacterium]|nr:CoB--CoM heterodisulfide reductase iron-sulfur subunit B family protein [Deltaproteobacteria bacterium]
MRLSFYPGCSLEGMANDYARSIDAVFKDLGIELVEIKDWSCCGSTAAHSLNQAMSAVLPARNLAAAEKMGLDLVSPCAMCFNRLRFSQNMIKKKVFDIPWPVTGNIRVHDMTRFLAEPPMIKLIKERILKPLNRLRVVCYYGCQMVRPPKITGYTDYENPQTIDRIVAATGAKVIDWSYKATCCGASIGVARKEIGESLTRRILQKARQTGAEAIVVSCPLCQSNLDMIQKDRSKILFHF